MPQEDGKTFPHFSILYLLPFLFSSPFVSLSSPILPSCIVLCNSQGCLPLPLSLSLSLPTSLSIQKLLTAAKWLPTNSYGLGQTTPLFSVLSIHPPLPRLPSSLFLLQDDCNSSTNVGLRLQLCFFPLVTHVCDYL